MSQSLPKPINDKPFPVDSVRDNYFFFTAGHLYGSKENLGQTWPSRNFFSAIFPINLNPTHFFIGMGDLSLGIRPEVELQNFSLITDQMNVPFINAPGNHDLRNRSLYKRHFFQEEWWFKYGEDLFLILNSESLRMDWPHDRLESILNSMRKEIPMGPHRNVFIFAHRPFWLMCHPEFSFVDDLLNESCKKRMDIKEAESAIELIRKIAGGSPTYWFGGDIGKEPNPTLMYLEDPENNSVFVSCGIGDRIEDALARVKVLEDGTVDIIFQSLTTDEELLKGDFGLERWRSSYDALIEKKAKKVKKPSGRLFYHHHLFWNGLFGGLGIGIILSLLVVKIARRRMKD